VGLAHIPAEVCLVLLVLSCCRSRGHGLLLPGFLRLAQLRFPECGCFPALFLRFCLLALCQQLCLVLLLLLLLLLLSL
jgi:hypothetical protein